MAASPRRAGWLALVAFFLLGAAWAVLTPYNGAYDEHDHVVRAAGVVRGQVLVPPAFELNDGGYQRVPASLVPPNVNCMITANPPPATCLGTPSTSRNLVEVHTRAARYNPVYYAVVGLPLRWLPNMTGVLLTRLISGAIGAVLLALSVRVLWPLRRYRLLLLGLLLAASPMLISLNGLVNPDSLAIDAAVLLWAALLRLTVGDRRAGDDSQGEPPGTGGTGTVWLAAAASAVIVLTRSEGPVLVVAIAALAWLALGRPPVRRRSVLVAVGTVGAAIAVTVIWAVLSHVASVGAKPPVTPPGSHWNVLSTIARFKFDYWLKQTVGLFGYGVVGLPGWAYLAWFAVLGGLVGVAAVTARQARLAATLVLIPPLCFAAGLVAEFALVYKIGYWMQGRYFLPIWVGLTLLAPLALGRLPEPVVRRSYLVGGVIWAALQVISLGVAFLAWHGGSGFTGPYPGSWMPALGPELPVLLLLGGLAATALLVRWYLAVPPRLDSVVDSAEREARVSTSS